MTDAASAFLGAREVWPQARLALLDVHGLWGGRNCFVAGTGQAVVQLVTPAQHEQRYILALAPAEAERLLAQAAALPELPPPRRSPLPDEAYCVLVVQNAAGQQRRLGWWSGDRPPAFEALAARLRDLAQRAAAGSPVYAGPYENGYAPPGFW